MKTTRSAFIIPLREFHTTVFSVPIRYSPARKIKIIRANIFFQVGLPSGRSSSRARRLPSPSRTAG